MIYSALWCAWHGIRAPYRGDGEQTLPSPPILYPTYTENTKFEQNLPLVVTTDLAEVLGREGVIFEPSEPSEVQYNIKAKQCFIIYLSLVRDL